MAGAGKVDDSKGPVFLKEPTNRIDFSNSTGAVVECSATGNPPPEMIWIRSDGTAVGDVPGLRQILPNGNLVFPPFRAEDYRQEVHAQVYACMAKNQFGSVISRDVNVRAGKCAVAVRCLLFLFFACRLWECGHYSLRKDKNICPGFVVQANMELKAQRRIM